MNLDLSHKTAFVTGASSGIGAATATILAEEGADVVVSYARDEAGAIRTAEAVRAHGRQAWLCQMDVSRPNHVNEAIRALPSEVSGLDVLVLAAGQNIITPFDNLSSDEWEEIVAVNLNGPFYVLRALTPLLRDGAAIVTVASVAAHTGAAHHAHYAAAKAGLINLTKSAARALAPRVRVNCVAPGVTLTPMGQETIAALAPDYAQSKLLVQRFATPDEVARTIVFLASPVAGFITGATLDINGGRDLR